MSAPMIKRQIYPNEEYPITTVELDVTNRCNLRCDYCYRKDISNANMPFSVAKRAVDWLIAASRIHPKITIVFFGGEPLMNTPLIHDIIHYARKRCNVVNKSVSFTATTNCTIMSNSIKKLWRDFGIGFHCSIDGIPEVQDAHRLFPNGKGTSDVINSNIREILSLRPLTFARSTICPDTAHFIYDNLLYFEKLGFRRFAFELEPEGNWSCEAIEKFDSNMCKLVRHIIHKVQKRDFVYIEPIFSILKELEKPSRYSFCGAGRGLVSIDVLGDIRPCHRFNGMDADAHEWVLGSVLGKIDFNDDLRSRILRLRRNQVNAPCDNCFSYAVCKGFCIAANYYVCGNLLTPPNIICRSLPIIFRHTLNLLSSLDDPSRKYLNKLVAGKGN